MTRKATGQSHGINGCLKRAEDGSEILTVPQLDRRLPCRRYRSDLSDAQWARLERLLPSVGPGGRRAPTREVIDAIRYVVRGEIAWRTLPHDYAPGQTAAVW
jgi:hypothetical protein